MQKRGKKGAITEETYMMIINIVIIMIVWGILIYYVRAVGKNTLPEKIYLSKDIALLTNTIYSSPGNTFYIYSDSSNKIDLTKYLYSFKDSNVNIKETAKDKNELWFPHSKDLSLKSSLPGLIEYPKEIHFVKSNNKLFINAPLTAWTEFGGGSFGGAGVTGTWTEGDNSENPIITDASWIKNNPGNPIIGYWSLISYLNQLSCPTIKIEEELANQNIVIDPGHGDNPAKDTGLEDFGFEFKDSTNFRNMKEAYITTKIANGVKANYPDDNNVMRTRDSDRYESTGYRTNFIEENMADVIISIHIGNYSNSYNTIKAFIPYKSDKFLQSRKLACNILNTFPSQIELDGIVIVLVDTSALSEEDPMQVINFEDKTAVLLEIGNINTAQGRTMFDDTKLSDISAGIYNGLTEYYKK